MQIPRVNLKNLEQHGTGRMRLKLFQEITKRDGQYPTKEQCAKYIEEIAESNFSVAELFTFLLTDGRFSPIKSDELKPHRNVNYLFHQLDQHPLDRPVILAIKGIRDFDIYAWVQSNELDDKSGNFNTVLLFSENEFPNSFIFYCEVRTSQLKPEPAISYIERDSVVNLTKGNASLAENELVMLSLDILGYISEIHTDVFVPIGKVSKQESEQPYNFMTTPFDKRLDRLLKRLTKNQVSCWVANVEISKVIPFDYDHCFKIPIHQINEMEKIAEKVRDQGILVYPHKNKFIMSDSYSSYLVLRKAEYDTIKVVILSKGAPKGVQVLNQGGRELIPHFVAHQSTGYNNLSSELKEILLQQYLNELNAITNLKDTINSKCVLFTEDKNTHFIQNLLLSNGFNIDETAIISYKNCTNVDAIDITIDTIRKFNSKAQIIVHRDRDYLVSSQVEKFSAQIRQCGALPFITKGTDIESYYINKDHIKSIYTHLDLRDIEDLILKADITTKGDSIANIKKHEYGDKYKSRETHFDEFVEVLYESNKLRFRDGKKTLGVLIGLLQALLKQNPNIVQPSEHLNDDDLIEYQRTIWN